LNTTSCGTAYTKIDALVAYLLILVERRVPTAVLRAKSTARQDKEYGRKNTLHKIQI
jgi:hypothetical protein